MPNIKDRIRELRKKCGYTQESLAKALGLNAKSSIANYENGLNAPSDEIKIKMCNLFSCSMDYLMGLTSYINPKEDLEKELYKLNISEAEFDEMISLLLDADNDNIDNVLRNSSKLSLACDKCLSFILDYDNGNNSHNHIERLTSIINSLDKKNIVHSNTDINLSTDKKFYLCPVYRKN